MQRQLKQMREELKLQNIEPISGEALRDRYSDQMNAARFMKDAGADQLVADLLTRNILWADIITERPGYVDPAFKDVYDRLFTIRNALESKSLLQAWSCRETDLYDFQRRLDRIDESRMQDGNFACPSGKPADIQTQRVSLKRACFLSYMTLTFSPDSPFPSPQILRSDLPYYLELRTRL